MCFRKESHGFEQGRGVSGSGRRQGGHDTQVAAFLLNFLQPSSCPPNDGMPPVQPQHEELQAANPVIAVAQVRQFVSQKSVLLLGA